MNQSSYNNNKKQSNKSVVLGNFNENNEFDPCYKTNYFKDLKNQILSKEKQRQTNKRNLLDYGRHQFNITKEAADKVINFKYYYN